jgi:hypothetical protein
MPRTSNLVFLPVAASSFRENFEQSQGLVFNPVNFRRYRLGQLRRADGFLYIRTVMSESGAFELCYNVFAEPRAPTFFAVWKYSPIKTTLLPDLGEVCDVTYREFEHPEELRGDLEHFFRRISKPAIAMPISPATHPIWRTETVRTNQGRGAEARPDGCGSASRAKTSTGVASTRSGDTNIRNANQEE